MTPEKALKHYKSRGAMARVAMVSRQAVAQWFKSGVVPPRSAMLLAMKSGGKLKAGA